MSAPDRVIFGPGSEGAPQVTWGHLRANPDESFRLGCLARRLTTFLHDQCATLTGIGAPVPTSTVALVGIGALAEIFYRDAIDASNKEHGRITFCKACDQLDGKFTRTPSKDFKDAFEARWKDGRPASASSVLYTYFRNSLIHGYYGEGVFLTGDETPDLKLEDDGCVLLNPDWFFDKFLKAVEWHCAEVLREQATGPLRYNALNYVRKLIGEAPLPPRKYWMQGR